MQQYEIIYPSEVLAPYISCYWILRTRKEEIIQEQIIPSGGIQLVFHLSGRIYSGNRQEWQPLSFLGGQATTHDLLSFPDSIEMLAVLFRPYGARAFFPFPMHALQNQTISIQELDLPWLTMLEEEVHLADSGQLRIEKIEQAFTKALYGTELYNIQRLTPSLRFASRIPEATLSRMADLSCLSPKQYRRIFSEYVGATPKEFLRIIRLQRALHLLYTAPSLTFQTVAFDCGYYDLAHMTHEFKLLTGYPPSEYLRRNDPYSDYFDHP
ncbi:MAG: helix-turn-helix domain-containing protein [Tannerellaceae bacterium]|nr:helix-turn-helix domain-containing protein [Tannerellaceae bacterium]